MGPRCPNMASVSLKRLTEVNIDAPKWDTNVPLWSLHPDSHALMGHKCPFMEFVSRFTFNDGTKLSLYGSITRIHMH